VGHLRGPLDFHLATTGNRLLDDTFVMGLMSYGDMVDLPQYHDRPYRDCGEGRDAFFLTWSDVLVGKYVCDISV